MLYLVPAILVSLYAVLCPYTKVEESFNIQAIHDAIYHAHNITNYDHHEFPGVVPRTFIGPIIVSAISSPFIFIFSYFTTSKLVSQYIVRMCLGLIVAYGLNKFTKALKLYYDSTTSKCFILIVCSQFHFLFYSSRPLPNVFALCLVLLALSSWLRNKNESFIWFSAAAIIIFRFELCILLGTCLVISLINGKINIKEILLTSIPAAVVTLGLTVLVDSYLWGHWVWPEGQVMWYNVFLNKSSNWGTSPFHWYFTSVLPRSLLTSILPVMYGVWLKPGRSSSLLIPSLAFILVFSKLPHKELRFIIYTFPMLNAVAASALAHIYNRSTSSKRFSLLGLISLACLVLNLMFSIILLSASLHNYPGGEILKELHEKIPCSQSPPVNLHICNLAAQTGVSRFGEQCPHWRYNKTENLMLTDLLHAPHITHTIMEYNTQLPTLWYDTYKKLTTVDSYAGFGLIKLNQYFGPVFPNFFNLPVLPNVKTAPALVLWQRRDFGNQS
ncbi:dol-P-Man:Man(7)GlcNAc(2)-PP-Dol alpha-1,6-mannosyltransferase isoform X1 [Ciona intestinalis]